MKKLLLIIAIAVMFISCSEEATKPIITQEELDIKNYENTMYYRMATWYDYEYSTTMEGLLKEWSTQIVSIDQSTCDKYADSIYNHFTYKGDNTRGVEFKINKLIYSTDNYNNNQKVLIEIRLYNKKINYKNETHPQWGAFYLFKFNNEWYQLYSECKFYD